MPRRKEETDETEKKEFELKDIEGIGPATVTKLEAAGINTVEALAFATEKKLENLGIKKEAATFIQKAREKASFHDFMTVSELMEQRKNIRMLSTGCKALDELFKGGFETQGISEFAGPYGSGKSQLSFTACVMVQQQFDKGGLEGGALFVDSEGTFKGERIAEIAVARGLDPKPILEHIIYSRAFTSDHQILILDEADKVIRDNNIKLIVVDSVFSHFRNEYLGREALPERQQKLNQHLHQLMNLARAFNTVAIVTNQVTANPSGMPYAPEWFATGGNIMAHANNLRVLIRKAGKNNRIATVQDSSWIGWGERPFALTLKGIEDLAPEEKLAKRYEPETSTETPPTETPAQ